MNSIKFKDLKRIVNELKEDEDIDDDTLVLVPTTNLLDKMRPLMTVGNNMEVYFEDGHYTICSNDANYHTKQKAIIFC